jgi:hypothetical protein
MTTTNSQLSAPYPLVEQPAQPPQRPPEPPSQRRPLVPVVYIVLGVFAVLTISVLLIVLMAWLAANYAAQIETVRDLVLIGLGLTSCLTSIVLIMLLIMTIRLVNMLEFEVKPILNKTNETLGTLRGTSVFVSRNVVEPMTTASSYLAGLRRGVATLFGNPRKNLDRTDW